MNALPPNSPQEPTADLRQAASAMRQMYVALTNEGFTERQALMIIGAAITPSRGADS